MTVAIEMGTVLGTGAVSEARGGPAVLDLEELLATRLLVQGNSGSGKSHLLRRLLEQSAPWVQQAVIDPEGDFVSLADRFNHLVIDADRQNEAMLELAGQRMRAHRVSVVLNLEGLDAEAQMRHAAAFLNGMFEAGRESWYPVLVAVDEAQLFAPAAAGDVSDEARRASLGAMANLMSRGRKRGLAGVIATQRLAKLAKNVAAEASNFLMGRTFLDIDMARAADLLGMERRQAEMFRDLGRGRFVALGPALSRRPVALQIGPVQTQSRGSGPTLTPLPSAAAEDVHALILEAPPAAAPRPPRRAAPPPVDILAQLAQARPEPAPVETPPPEAREDQLRQADSVLGEMLAEPEAAYRAVPVLYQDFLVRCRIRALPVSLLDPAAFRRRLATRRAGVSVAAQDSPEWEAAAARASALAEDVQGVFLLLARCAMTGAACPSDAELARAYGTHSLGRARRLLAYLEEQGEIVCQSDAQGRRRVAITGLGWQTEAADPQAAVTIR